MPEVLRLYVRLTTARLRGQMQYRVSFLLTLLSSFMITVIEFAGVLVLFSRTLTRLAVPRWMALAVSAGMCEEFIFRGYLIWVLQPALGLWIAAAASLIVFAAAHAYQGAKGVVAVGVVGGLFTLIVLVFGSLVPAIAVHILGDAGEGLVAWLALRDVAAGHDGASGPS